MAFRYPIGTRREFLGGLALGALACSAPGAFAEELARTPKQMEGPFYPDKLPLDTDNDLIIVNDELTPAVGEITHLTGRILDTQGEPLRNALVEIWQCDSNGAYLHSGTTNRERRDAHFQGFGRFLTGSTGQYYFRTIKPVAYPGRTPHIHFKVFLDQANKQVGQASRDHGTHEIRQAGAAGIQVGAFLWSHLTQAGFEGFQKP